jgi:acetyl esterase/lipase
MIKPFVFMMIFFGFCMWNGNVISGGHADELTDKTANKNYARLTTADTIGDIVNHPAFKGFAQRILPWDDNRAYYDTRLSNAASLLPYHSHVNSRVVVDAINHMIDEAGKGHIIFHDFYTRQQKREDPSKEPTGLFFFKGKPGAPFAVICPGGGFSYVGSLHEGFPYALELNKKGYNAFVIRYRLGSGARAARDLTAAVSYIAKKSQLFEVSPENYSLWGSSAGARIVGDFASFGAIDPEGLNIPRPRAAMIIYTGHTRVSGEYPPTFITVSKDYPHKACKAFLSSVFLGKMIWVSHHGQPCLLDAHRLRIWPHIIFS